MPLLIVDVTLMGKKRQDTKISLHPLSFEEAIVDYAATKKISLIVMASHGRSGIGRWTLGSVAEKVVRGGSSPVLLVRSQTRE